MRAAYLALVALVVAAAAVVESRGGSAHERNLVADACVVAVLLGAGVARGRALDLPFVRWKPATWVLVAGTAVASTARTLTLPYLSDDYAHLDRAAHELTPLHSLLSTQPVVGEFYRPVAWSAWWFLERAAPNDAWPARAICIALFAGVSCLVVPALRRMGVPRGVSVASAVIFAASPVAVEITAWVSNLYSILSLGFALAAVATLPVGRPTWRSFRVPALFTLLSFFSKEDTVFLPFLLVLAGARFRARRVPAWLAASALPFAAVAAGLAARIVLFGGLGGYRTDDGGSFFVSRWWAGVERALDEDCPARLLIPTRTVVWQWAHPWVHRSLAWLPVALLVLGGGSRIGAVGALRGCVLAVLGLVPVGAALFVHSDLLLVRHLFFATVGVSLMATSMIAGASWGGRARWVAVGALALASLLTGERNFAAWRRAGQTMRACVAAALPRLASLGPDSHVVVYGLPDSILGAYCFTGAVPWAFQRAAKRFDFTMQAGDPGRFDAVLEFDARRGVVRDPLDAPEGDRIRLEGTATLQFRGARSDRVRCRFLGGSDWIDPGNDWVLFPTEERATLLLPCVEAPAGSEVEIRVDCAIDEGGKPAPRLRFAALLRNGDSIERRELGESARLQLPEKERVFRFEILLPEGKPIRLRSAELRAAARSSR